jgi:hypothetical protein
VDKTLALEAETAIIQLPIFEQDYIRYQVVHNIKQLHKQHKDKHAHNTTHMRKEKKKTINKIKGKLITNKAIISKTDKGKSVIITYQDEYHKQFIDFISKNNFTFAKNDLTKKFQRELRSNINE